MIVTVTSIVPCPVSTTTVVYQCGLCQTTAPPHGYTGTTTVTLTTTTTPFPVTTITSNGLVIVMMDTTTGGVQTTTATASQQLVAGDGVRISIPNIWLTSFCLGCVVMVMLVL